MYDFQSKEVYREKQYDEEYEREIEMAGFLRGDYIERFCRNGEDESFLICADKYVA